MPTPHTDKLPTSNEIGSKLAVDSTDQFEEIVKTRLDIATWMRNRGIDDNDTFRAEDVEEILQDYFDDVVTPKLHHIRRETEKGMMEKVGKQLREYKCGKHRKVFKLLRSFSHLESDNSTQK